MQKTAILWENNEFIHKHSFFFEKLEKLSTAIHTIFFSFIIVYSYFLYEKTASFSPFFSYKNKPKIPTKGLCSYKTFTK